MKLFKELFNGRYDGVSPPTLLKPGDIVGGKNMRKVGDAGGWKTRKGATLGDTSAIAAYNIDALYFYEHPRNEDQHFLAQVNSNIYEANAEPPTVATSWSSLFATSTTTPMFADRVRELLFIGDGGGAPLIWGGDNPFCTGFIGHFDISDNGTPDTYVNFTREVTDNRTATSAVLHSDVHNSLYICSPQIADGIKFTMGGTVNDVAATATLKAWRSGAWAAVTGLSDGTLDTATSTKTLAQTGTMTWTKGSDEMTVINGIMGYWYQITFSAALTASVTVTKCQVTFDMARMTNKWNGVYEWIGGCRYYDDEAYQEHLGDVTNSSTATYMDIGGMDDSMEILVRAPEPICGIGFGVDADYPNDVAAAAVIGSVSYWNGSAWTAITTLTDETQDATGTSSFVQTGTVWFNASGLTVKRRTFDWDSIPGYWYKVKLAASDTLATEVRIWSVTYVPFPESLAETDGCIEFKGRLFTWGDPEFPNRLRFSAKDFPDCFSGSDSGYTEQFGDMDKILCCKRFYNELLIFKKNEVYLMEGYSPATFGSLRLTTTVGLASPQTAKVIEVGSPTMHKDEPLSIAIWQETDGIYLLDGRKPRKVSGPVEDYFNPEYSNCISTTYIRNRHAFVDKNNNEYHLLLPTAELVYNFVRDEWYPAWERAVDLTCGHSFRGSDDRWYSYGGCSTGFVYRLENGTTDKATDNANTAIESSIKTRAISADQKMSTTMSNTFRKNWIEAKALAAGSITTKIYPDLASVGVALSKPTNMSLVNTGYDLCYPQVYDSKEGIACFQLEYIATALDFEIYSILYEIDIRGELSVL